MIVKKAQGRGGGSAGRGHSFKGLSAYLLDPKDAGDRALWAQVENVGTDNPLLAARIMAATARSADQLKAQAGVARTGRKSEAGAVYHLVMSWPEDQQPDQAHQEAAARALLDRLGMASAQALLVAHNDNGKAHVHLMVNLVDPETGKQFSLSNDQRAMQDWALNYEKANGGVRCEQREANAQARATGETTRDTKSLSRVEWERLKADRDALLASHAAERAQMKGAHSADWTAAKSEVAARKAAYTKAIRAAYAEAKAADKLANKPLWREVFKRHESERFNAGDVVSRLTAETTRAVADAAKARRAVETAERRAHSFLFRKVLPIVGITSETPDQARARYSIALADRAQRQANLEAARQHKAALPSLHDAERARLAKELDAVTRAKASLAVDQSRPDLEPMKARHAAEIEAVRDRQNEERASLGIRAYEPRPREPARDRPRVGETPRNPSIPSKPPTPFSVAANRQDQAAAMEADRRRREKDESQDRADKTSLKRRERASREKTGEGFTAATGRFGPKLTPEQQERRQALRQRDRTKSREDDFDRER